MSRPSKRRVDELLVERGLAEDREQAARLVLAGEVWSGDRRLSQRAALLAPDTPLEIRRRRRFVSRGGDKLAAALDAFGIDVRGAVGLDAGASTGGFTDVLLRRGARRVYAVDVGYGQLDPRLRQDRRVVAFERTNIRALEPAALDPRPTLVVADLAFVALRSVIDVLAGLAAPEATFLVLVKPQFELEESRTSGGVVRDPALHDRAVDAVAERARAVGLVERGRVASPLRGPKGNREFFLWLERVARTGAAD